MTHEDTIKVAVSVGIVSCPTKVTWSKVFALANAIEKHIKDKGSCYYSHDTVICPEWFRTKEETNHD